MDGLTESRRWLFGILCVAFLLRVGAAWGIEWTVQQRGPEERFLIGGDADGYWMLAGKLVLGEDYAIYEPPRFALRMPGFPAVLALARLAAGDHVFPARILLCLIGTLACWGVWRLSLTACDATIARWATGMAACSPVLVGFTPLILSETSFAAAMVWSLVPLLHVLRLHTTKDQTATGGTPARFAIWQPICGGLLAALACYLRPSWLLFPCCFGIGLIWLSRNRLRAIRDALLINGVMVLCLVPWGIRNKRVTGHFVLTTLWLGPSLYDGLNEQANGDSDMSFFERDAVMSHGMSEYEMNRYYRSKAITFVKENPWRTIELAVVKLARYFKPWPNAEQFRRPAIQAAVVISFLPLVLALIGLRANPLPFPQLSLLIGPILYFAAIHSVFVSSLRYRLPAEYPLLTVSAIGLVSLQRQLMRRRPVD